MYLVIKIIVDLITFLKKLYADRKFLAVHRRQFGK